MNNNRGWRIDRWLSKLFDISTGSLHVASLAVLAGISVNLAASAIYTLCTDKLANANYIWGAGILILFALLLAWRTVSKLPFTVVRNLEEKEGDPDPHGAVILALSVVSKGNNTAANYANDVVSWVNDYKGERGTKQFLKNFSASRKDIGPAWKEGHAWQALVTAVIPHIIETAGDAPNIVPPIFILTSKTVGATEGSDGEYEHFKRAFDALFQGFSLAEPLKQKKGLDFEDFNELRDSLEDTLKDANTLAKEASSKVIQQAIIDVTGAPRPFAIVAASLTLGNRNRRFTYVSQSNGELRQYNLVARFEQPGSQI